MTQIAAGTLLAGKYRLEAMIGSGGMGSVWRAQHLALNAPVAVKLLHVVDFASSNETLARFHREAHAAAAIRSPHVVQIFDHGFDPELGAPFIVMELMEGESLASRLSRLGRIPPAAVALVFSHIARALSRAHEAGIVHRDLKPDNVFLVRNEEEEIAKVLDFGIAKSQAHTASAGSGTRTGAVMGTAYYMSPEQIEASKDLDYRSDLWAFGVMACECLTGVRPFNADSLGGLTLQICVRPIPAPSSLAAVPPGFDEWFAKIVNRDPAQRFASAREAAEALRVVCTGEANTQRISEQPASATVVSAGGGHLGTGAPLSRSAHEWRSPPARQSFTLPLFLIAGTALAIVVATLVWLRRPNVTPAAVRSAALATDAPPPIPAPAVTQPPVPQTPLCEAGATQCSNTTPQTCSSGQWQSNPISAGQCGAECSPASAAPRCTGGKPQACDATGKWQDGQPCSRTETCRAGQCVVVQTPPPSPPPAANNPPKPNCDPSYTLDAQGQKHFKPECYK